MKNLKYIWENWNSPDRRPIGQMLLLFPLWLCYVPAKAYVEFVEKKF